ncbi:MAG: hypothetical protein K5697_01395 [Lachnospiraceae bacterium]|nr:hypothetical protein [Lachnospiraceae bacterium]
MKVKRFFLISFLLTILMFGVMIPSLLVPKEIDALIMLNLAFMLFAAGSWLLTIVDLFMLLTLRPYLPGLKSYRILSLILMIAAAVFGIVSVIREKGFTGSSAEMILLYLIPLLIIVYVLLDIIERKRNKNPDKDPENKNNKTGKEIIRKEKKKA